MNTTKASPAGRDRKIAAIVGVLYIIGTAAGVASVVLSTPILEGPDFLVKMAANETQFVVAAVMVLLMGLALAMVPVMLFSILKEHNQVLALGYVVFRGALETMTYIAMVIMWLFLLIAAREYAAGGPESLYFQTLGSMFKEGNDSIATITGIVFCLGALMLYFVFCQARLVPRWISVWGFIAIILNLATGFLILFRLQSAFSTINLIMNFPIFLQEMVMAVWLIVKGFNPSPVSSLSVNTPTPELLRAA